MNQKTVAPRLDLALVAHEISDKLNDLLEQYNGKLVLCRERKTTTLQIQFDDEDELAMTLISAHTMGSFEFRPIGQQVVPIDDLPDWLDFAAWNRWLAYRAEIRKPLTKRTRKAQLQFLGEQHRKGLSQAACIDQSIQQGWTGLFACKTSQRIDRGRNSVDAFIGGDHDRR